MESAGSIHPEPFRIALISDGLFPLSIGGMQKHTTRLAAHLADAGAEVLLFHPHHNLEPGKLFTEQQLQRISCIYVAWPSAPAFPGHYLLQNYRYSQAVHRILRQEQRIIDAVYVQGFSGWKTINAGLNRIPVVLNLHGMEMFQTLRGRKNRMHGLLLRPPARKLMRRADAVVSLGGKLSDIIRRLAPGQKIIELPVGIDAAWLGQKPVSTHGQERRVLFVGRYEWRKGLDVLNSVIPELLAESPVPVSFRFIGDIPAQHRIHSPAVHYYGPMRDEEHIRSIYQSSDVLVCPSYSEGMPTVILEAMALGLPVVATDVGAVGLLVSDANGRLIEPGNAPELKQALMAVLTSTDRELQQMQQVSTEKAADFSWERVARLSLQGLQELKRTLA
jgi:glycosyltransferase involved in cell wall biosynthesis